MQSEIEPDKAVVHAFYQAGMDGQLTSFARYLDPDFTWTAPNYLPWGGTHTGAALFRDQVLSSLPEVFDFARFSYISVIAEEGRVDAVINQGVMGTDAVIKGCLFRTPGAARQTQYRPRAPSLTAVGRSGPSAHCSKPRVCFAQ
jgi:ketosteroid isomerase-like protein